MILNNNLPGDLLVATKHSRTPNKKVTILLSRCMSLENLQGILSYFVTFTLLFMSILSPTI